MRSSWLLECKYHTYPRIREPERGIKCQCQSCMQYKRDLERTAKVRKNHITGKICKEWNQCSVCSRIKYFIRSLRHYGNCDHSKRRCDICQYYDRLGILPKKDSYMANTKNIIRDLYIQMLKR